MIDSNVLMYSHVFCNTLKFQILMFFLLLHYSSTNCNNDNNTHHIIYSWYVNIVMLSVSYNFLLCTLSMFRMCTSYSFVGGSSSGSGSSTGAIIGGVCGGIVAVIVIIVIVIVVYFFWCKDRESGSRTST